MAITSTQQTKIINLYVGMFNKAPSAAKLSELAASFSATTGSDDDKIYALAETLSTTTDYTTKMAGKVTSEAIALQLIENAGLDSTKIADTAELEYHVYTWAVNTSNDGVASHVIMAAYSNFINVFDHLADETIWADAYNKAANKTEVAEYYATSGSDEDPENILASVTEDPTTVDTAKSTVDGSANPGQTFSLTAGVDGLDTMTGTTANDTFNANTDTINDKETFTSLDALDGGDGEDVLNINSTKDADFTTNAVGVSISNIETANVTASTALGINTSAWMGLETLNINGVDTYTVTAADTTDVNMLSSINTVDLTGGKDVTIVHEDATGQAAKNIDVDSIAGDINITSTHADYNKVGGGTAGGTVTVGTTATNADDALGTVTVAAQDDIEIFGATEIDASAANAVTADDRAANIVAATATETAKVAAQTAATEAANIVTDLTNLKVLVAANTTVELTMVDTCTYLDAVTATNAALTQANKTAIDAAFASAYADKVGTTAEKQAAGQTAAVAVVDAMLVTANTTKEAADAALVTATAADTAADAVVTADGVIDAISGGVDVDAAENTALTSVTIADNIGATNTIEDETDATLTTVTIENSGTSTLTGDVITNVSLTDQYSDVTINNTKVSHTQNLTIDSIGTSTTDVQITDAAATTVNIASTGTNYTELTAGAAKAVNLSGTGNITLVAATAMAADAVVTSTSTGNVTATLAAGQSYVGAAGVDTITAVGNTQTVSVDAGAGTSDVLSVTASVDSNTVGDVTAASFFKNFEVLSAASGKTVDVTAFANSTFTSFQVAGTANIQEISNDRAYEEATTTDVTVTTGGAFTLGIKDATVNGNLDTVNLTMLDFTSLAAASMLGVETLTIVGDGDATKETITITDMSNMNSVSSLTASGAENIDLTTATVSFAANTKFNFADLTGTVTVDASDSEDTGLSITGSATGVNVLTGSDDALDTILKGGSAGDTLTTNSGDDRIESGDGNDTINAGDGANTVIAGDGNNTIVTGTGNDNVTAGNGYNIITTGAGNDTIIVGTGGVCKLSGPGITAGTGADSITLGDHADGVISVISQGAGDSIDATAVTAVGATLAAGDTVTFGDGVDVVTGFDASSDKIFGATAGTAVTMIGVAHATLNGATVYFVSGEYDATTKVFTAAADGTGADTMIVDGANTQGTSLATNDGIIILKGVDSDTLTTTTFSAKGAHGTLTYAQALAAYNLDNTAVYDISDDADVIVGGTAAVLDQANNISTGSDAATMDEAISIEAFTNGGTNTYSISDTMAEILHATDGAIDATIADKIELATATTITINNIGAGAEVVEFDNLTVASAATTIDFVDSAVTLTQAEAKVIADTSSLAFTAADAITVTGVTVAGGDFAEATTIDKLSSTTTADTIAFNGAAATLDAANYKDVFETKGTLATSTDTITVTMASASDVNATAAIDIFDVSALTSGQSATIDGTTIAVGDKIDLGLTTITEGVLVDDNTGGDGSSVLEYNLSDNGSDTTITYQLVDANDATGSVTTATVVLAGIVLNNDNVSVSSGVVTFDSIA